MESEETFSKLKIYYIIVIWPNKKTNHDVGNLNRTHKDTYDF